MRHLPILDVSRRLVREMACVRCSDRPPGSETLGPEVVRPCEGACPLFVHLPRLVQLAGEIGDGPGACDAAVVTSVCADCRMRPSSGDFCADFSARTCPLSRYSSEIIGALQRMAHGPA